MTGLSDPKRCSLGERHLEELVARSSKDLYRICYRLFTGDVTKLPGKQVQYGYIRFSNPALVLPTFNSPHIDSIALCAWKVCSVVLLL